MRNKAVEFNFFSTAITGMVLAGILVTGCARDNSRNAVNDFFENPTDHMSEAAKRDLQQTASPRSNDKLILADFTGSDWCHWCVKLKKDVFETPEFKSWANENVVLLELDYPRNGSQPAPIREQNQMLKSRYNISSYPTVLLLDAEGRVRAKMGYEQGKTPSQWVQIAESRLQAGNANSRVANQGSGARNQGSNGRNQVR